MMVNNKGKWGEKIRIVGISMDKSPEIVKNHVKKQGWTAVEHYFIGNSISSHEYGVEGIPHVVLIDQKGNIKYVGHPEAIDLEEAINSLVNSNESINVQNDN